MAVDPGWVVLLVPRGGERELCSHGEVGFRPFFATDSQGRERSIVVVPLHVAQSGLANGPGGYAYTDDPALVKAAETAPDPVRSFYDFAG
jgi:hypothetical protein